MSSEDQYASPEALSPAMTETVKLASNYDELCRDRARCVAKVERVEKELSAAREELHSVNVSLHTAGENLKRHVANITRPEEVEQ